MHPTRLATIGPVLGLMAFALFAPGCKREPPPPPKMEPIKPAQRDEDLQAIGSLLDKEAPAAGSQVASLPPGHPPINGSAPSAAQPSPSLPAGHPPIGAGAAAPTPPSEPDALSFEAPAAWKSEPVASAMRKAQYLIPRAAGDQEDGQMVVFYFGPGQGGNVDMNVDRWRKMFSTADGEPVGDDAVKTAKRTVNGLSVTTLEVTGRYVDPMSGAAGPLPPQRDSRMLSAIVETPQGLWFFKGVGPVATMNEHAEAFQRLVASIRNR